MGNFTESAVSPLEQLMIFQHYDKAFKNVKSALDDNNPHLLETASLTTNLKSFKIDDVLRHQELHIQRKKYIDEVEIMKAIEISFEQVANRYIRALHAQKGEDAAAKASVFLESNWDYGIQLDRNCEAKIIYPLVYPSKAGIKRALQYELTNSTVLKQLINIHGMPNKWHLPWLPQEPDLTQYYEEMFTMNESFLVQLQDSQKDEDPNKLNLFLAKSYQLNIQNSFKLSKDRIFPLRKIQKNSIKKIRGAVLNQLDPAFEIEQKKK